MATHKMSRFLCILGIVLFLLTMQMTSTEAAFKWFGSGGQQKERSTSEREGPSSRKKTHTARPVPKYHFDIEAPDNLLAGGTGKQLYEKSITLAKQDSCWEDAYNGLQATCRDILADQNQRSRLALRLTNCLLKTSGRPLLQKCPDNWSIENCVKALDNHNHALFLSFFIDSASICHYLQSQEFKKETEQLVNDLKVSAQYTENKLDAIGQELDDQHAAILERSENILSIQKKLQLEHALLQESIQAGMGHLQEAADEAQQQLDLVNQYQNAIAEKQQELAESLRAEFSDLERKSTQLGNSMANLHGIVEDLTQKSILGQEEAMQSLSDLQRIQVEGIKESRISVDALIEEARRHQAEFQTWQTELNDMHHRLVDGTTNMIQAQEVFVSKQAAIFSTMEKLFSLHNSILLESRAVKTLTLYFALSIFVYMATTTKQTRNARLLLYFGLFLTLTFEIWLIRFNTDKSTPQTMRLTSPSKKSMWLRYGYGGMALTYLFYTFITYKDYSYLSYKMLKDMHGRFGDQSRLQEQLLAEYLARCEACKEIPQPNGQPPGQPPLPYEDDPTLPYEDCESDFKEPQFDARKPRRSRSAMGRPRRSPRTKDISTRPLASPQPRARRAAGSSQKA